MAYAYLREKEARMIFGVSRRCINNWCEQGLLKKRKVGHKFYVKCRFEVDEHGTSTFLTYVVVEKKVHVFRSKPIPKKVF